MTYQCAGCDNDFTSLAAFDQHWPPPPARCLPPSEAGLELGDRGKWRIPLTPEQQNRLLALRGSKNGGLRGAECPPPPGSTPERPRFAIPESA